FFNQPESDNKTWKILIPIDDLKLFRNNYILVEGAQAQLKSKKQVKDLRKQQKQAEKAQKKASKEKKKQEKIAKKAQQAMQEQMDKLQQQGM
ncbi:hypothetical protein, partial [Snodgrassella alvi]